MSTPTGDSDKLKRFARELEASFGALMAAQELSEKAETDEEVDGDAAAADESEAYRRVKRAIYEVSKFASRVAPLSEVAVIPTTNSASISSGLVVDAEAIERGARAAHDRWYSDNDNPLLQWHCASVSERVEWREVAEACLRAAAGEGK